MKNILMAEVHPIVVTEDSPIAICENEKIVARLFPDGVAETYQGYHARKVALGLWSMVISTASSMVFFPNGQGEGLVTFNRDGKPTYRPDYKPDAVAQELWEAVAKADPGYHVTAEEPFTIPAWVDLKGDRKGGTKPNPGFQGMWGTGTSIDCYRPR